MQVRKSKLIQVVWGTEDVETFKSYILLQVPIKLYFDLLYTIYSTKIKHTSGRFFKITLIKEQNAEKAKTMRTIN